MNIRITGCVLAAKILRQSKMAVWAGLSERNRISSIMH